MNTDQLPDEIPVSDAAKYLSLLDGGDGGLPNEIPVSEAAQYLPFLESLSQPGPVASAVTPPSTSYGTPIDPTPYLPDLPGRMTQGFGVPQAVAAAGERIHAGVDIAAPAGTPIPANFNGTVIGVEDNKGGYGKSLIVEGEDGLVRRYSHLSAIHKNIKDQVKSGDLLAAVGSTGASTGPHLDLRTYKKKAK